MIDMNEIHLTGRLVKDVELRSTATGHQFVWFTLAVNGNRTKDNQQKADFIACQLWDKPAQIMATFGKRGTRILINRGSLKTYTKIEESTGLKQSYTFVQIQGFEFIDGYNQEKAQSFLESMGENIEF